MAKSFAQRTAAKIKRLSNANRQDARSERKRMDSWAGSRKLRGDGELRTGSNKDARKPA